MKNLTPLFISYLYPPAGGTALPGSQRTVKFIRYLQNLEAAYVLTVKPECYPDGLQLQLNFNLSLPINGEIIVREEARDRFYQAMQLRAKLSRMFTKKSSDITPSEEGDAHAVDCAWEENTSSLTQRITDFIYHAYYFPDPTAAPWLKPAVRAGLKLVREKKINIIFATGTPWTALVVARLISKKTGVPFIADFRDPWLGNPFSTSKGKLLDWRERICERKIVEEAALITANTEPLREEFKAIYPNVSADRIITLPNGFDTHDFDHLLSASARKRENAGKLVLAHAGFLYGKRDPAPLLNVLEQLCRHHPALAKMVEFQQMGDVALEYNFKKRYEQLIDKGVLKMLGLLPYNDCLAKLVEADVLVIIQPGTKTQVPSKLYDYLCINRPILTITPHDGALGNLIRENNFGDLFSPDEQDSLLEKLIKFCEMKKNNRSLTANYPDREKFDVRHIAGRLEEKMKHIVRTVAES